MAIRIKTIGIPLFTLLVGVSLGMFIDANFARARRERRSEDRPPPPGGRPPGFMNRIERVIEPRDAAQGDSIHAILQDASDANSRIISDANARLRERNDTLRRRLAPLLDPEQLARLDRELDRMPAVGSPPPGRGGPPPEGRGGAPPDGRGRGGPPPDRPPFP